MRVLVFFFAAALAAQTRPVPAPQARPVTIAKEKRAKNVILFLADASGIATLNAASILGYNAPLKLFVQSWPNVGLSDTTPVGRWVSDSAAGMTAIITGRKTNNGVLSQAPDAERGKKDGTPLKTLLEYAEERGLATGVVSNMTITDATPAACFSHVNDRRDFAAIYQQLFEPRFGDGVDVLIGPGRKRIFEDVRKTGKDPEAIAKEKSRPVYASLDELQENARRGLVISDGPFDLAASSKKALSMLSKSPKGYFLMIEGDAHTDKPDVGLSRLVAFDKLIREIAAMVNLNDTLLVFTADHSFDLRVSGGGPETPLLKGLEEWNRDVQKGPMRLPNIRMENTHTGEEVLVTAMGAGSERVRGFMPNTQIFQIMMKAYGWKETSAEPVRTPVPTSSLKQSPPRAAPRT